MRYRRLFSFSVALVLASCGGGRDAPLLVDQAQDVRQAEDYLIGAGDAVQVFVWRSPDLSASVQVRPDGRISVPLIDDLPVAGKTPSQVAREVEAKLAEYVVAPKVTVIMQDFVGPLDRRIRVLGEAAKPQAVPFRRDITVLDVLIAAGGLTPFAAGNRAMIVRRSVDNVTQDSYRVRLTDLMDQGDMSANVQLAPGDVIIIPQKWF